MAKQITPYHTVETPSFPPIDAEATGKHVYRLLKEHGYTPMDIAHMVGATSPQVAYNWKDGKRMPKIDNLDIISSILGISINDLLVHFGDEEVPRLAA